MVSMHNHCNKIINHEYNYECNINLYHDMNMYKIFMMIHIHKHKHKNIYIYHKILSYIHLLKWAPPKSVE